MQVSDRIQYLWQRYAEGNITDQELDELRSLLQNTDTNEQAMEYLRQMMEQTTPLEVHSETRLNAVMQKIRAIEPVAVGSTSVVVMPPDQQPETGKYHRRWFRFAAAASILLVLGTGAYLWFTNNRKIDQSLANGSKYLQNDIIPGGQKAILTLSGGSIIVLDSAANGMLTQQGNTDIIKQVNGEIAYNVIGNSGNEVLYNTMTTPRGGQYKLRLPDGTDVWLNSASSITYPTAFSGKDRSVTITGEAYFEVAKDKTKPFFVKVNDMEVQVLGTHFNINSYQDEGAIKTTLLEGSVKVMTNVGGSSDQQRQHQPFVVLKPGQQAQVVPQQGIAISTIEDTEEVIAWKSGLFHFNRADIKTIMRQIARWYDVEVVYEGAVPADKFIGELPMDANVSQVLRALEKIQIHFRIEGKKIIVMP